MNDERFSGGDSWPEIEIHEGKVDVSTIVIFPWRRASCRVPKGSLGLAFGGMPEGVEGLIINDLTGARLDTRNGVYGIDLGGILPANIGNDLILGLGMIEPQRFGNLRKQIDDRHASQTEGILCNGLFQSGQPPEEKQDLGTVAEACSTQVFETKKI